MRFPHFFSACRGVLLVSLMLTGAALSYSADANMPQTLAAVRERGQLIVGSKQAFPTFNVRDAASGRNEGFFADLARALAKHLLGDESKVEFRQTTDENRFEKLAHGEVDVLLDTIPANDEKDRAADRSDETFVSGSAFLVPRGSAIRGLVDIKAGTRVAYVTANEDIAVVKKHAPDAVYLAFENSNDALAALIAGRADAFTQVVTHLFRAASRNAGYVVVGQFTQKPYYIFVRKGDAEMRASLNAFLKDLRASGEYDRLYTRWFGPYLGDKVP